MLVRNARTFHAAALSEIRRGRSKETTSGTHEVENELATIQEAHPASRRGEVAPRKMVVLAVPELLPPRGPLVEDEGETIRS
jgi:hypothetical protein